MIDRIIKQMWENTSNKWIWVKVFKCTTFILATLLYFQIKTKTSKHKNQPTKLGLKAFIPASKQGVSISYWLYFSKPAWNILLDLKMLLSLISQSHFVIDCLFILHDASHLSLLLNSYYHHPISYMYRFTMKYCYNPQIHHSNIRLAVL